MSPPHAPRRSSSAALPLLCAVLAGMAGPRAAASQDGDPAPGPADLWQPLPGAPTAGPLGPGTLADLRMRAEERGDPSDWLALGAALLHSGDWEGATLPLRRALETAAPDRQEDPAYDLALAHALSGHPDLPASGPLASRPPRPPGPDDEAVDYGTPRERLLRARDGFRAVLRQNPQAEDARWNLELVERWLENEAAGGPADSGSGGGGEVGGEPGTGGAGGATSMSPEELQRLLEAAAAQEREVQNRRLERNQGRDPPVEQNW